MSALRGALAALTGCMLMTASISGIAPALAQTPADNAAAAQDAANEDDEPAAGTTDVRPFSIAASAALSELYESNARGAAQGSSDYTTQGQLGFDLHDQSQRFKADVHYSVIGNYHPQDSALNSFQNYLNAITHAELVEDHLFLDARGFASPTFISRLGSLDAGGGSSATANSRNAYGYVASPDLVFRFGDFATSHLTLTQGGQFFSNLGNTRLGSAPIGGPRNAQSTTLQEQLKGGEAFGRLEWTLTALATNASQTTFDQKQRAGEADLTYHINHDFGIIANLGYRKYTSRPALTHGISGMIAMGGISFDPNPRLSVLVKAGKQYQFTSYAGHINYQFGAVTALLVNVDDFVTTPQDRLLIGLTGLDSTNGVFLVSGSALPDTSALPTGTVPSGALPISLAPLDGLAIDNILSRYRTAKATLIHEMPRLRVNLSAYGTVRDFLLPVFSFSARQTVMGGTISMEHDITRDLSATVIGDYSVADEFGGRDKIMSAGGSLNYNMSPDRSAFFKASYIARDAKRQTLISNGSVSDVQLGLGLRYNF